MGSEPPVAPNEGAGSWSPEVTTPAVREAPATLAYAVPLPETRLHPLTLLFAGWNAVRGFIVPLLVLAFLRRGSRDWGWVPFAAGGASIAVGWALIKYYTFSYWITGGELIVRSGLLARTERHIPLTRVQDVRIKQGPLHRLLRVVEAQIETAGGQGAEATLSVLSQVEADRLRTAIFSQRGLGVTHTPAALESSSGAVPLVTPVPERRTVRRVTTGELILAGLTSNQVASGLAVVAALVAFLGDVFDLEDFGPHIARAVEAFRAWLQTGGSAAVAVVAVGAIVLVVLVGMAISIVGALLLFYGFELSLAGEDLHRSYGLLTRHASSLPRKRIQVLKVEEGVLRRLLRLATLEASSAGSKAGGQEVEKGTDVLLPVVRREEVDALLPVVFPDAADHGRPDWQRVSRRAVWRGTLRGAWIVALFTAAAVVSRGTAGLLVPAVLLPLVYAVNLMAYRHLGYAKDAAFVRVRRGWLSRKTHMVPVRNLQTVILTQTPFDRRHGVATVRVDTAGQSGGAPRIGNVPAEEAGRLAVELAHDAAAQRYRF